MQKQPNELLKRLLNLLISLDQFLFCVLTLGKAEPDETASSAAWAGELQGHLLPRFFRPLIDLLFAPIEKNHCRTAFEAERGRWQIPDSYK